MTEELMPWLARLERETDPAAFARAALRFRAFLVYTAAHGTDAPLALTTHQRAELTALQQTLAAIGDSASRGDDAISAVCASLALVEDDATEPAALRAVWSAWLTFAQASYDAGDSGIALSVVRRIAFDAETAEAIAVAARARLLEGFLYIRGGDLAGAQHVLRHAEQLGRTAGDQSIVLRSRLGRANILWMRGNLPGAEAQLNSLIRAARGAAHDVLPTVLLVRGSVAHARGKYADAVAWALQSFEASDDATQQARALTDLANFLTEFPDSFLARTAQRALEYVTVHGPEQSGRNHASITLAGLALDRADVTAFRRWTAYLASRDLRPRHAVLYALYRAKGARLFALSDDRDQWLRIAAEAAKTHGFAQLAFDIEAEATASLPEAMRPTLSSPASPSVPRTSASPDASGVRVPRRVRRVAETVNIFLDTAPVA